VIGGGWLTELMVGCLWSLVVGIGQFVEVGLRFGSVLGA
jgi:hypothetical protein